MADIHMIMKLNNNTGVSSCDIDGAGTYITFVYNISMCIIIITWSGVEYVEWSLSGVEWSTWSGV